MKYFIVAGERSGDLHASNLIRSINNHDSNAEFIGIGGELMEKAGMIKVVDYSEIAIMGFIEALVKIRKVFHFLNVCKKEIISSNPDVVILVDFAGFNLRVASFAKKLGFKVFYYISPKIWAWNTSRAYKIIKVVDKMFVILPFEKDFYAKFEMNVDYVGNPILDAIDNFKPNPNFRVESGLDYRPIIAILPGSRKQEIEHMLHYMVSILPSFRNHQFVIAGLNMLPKSYYEPYLLRKTVKIVFDRTYDLLTVSDAALVTSGTATLETALFRVPQVVCYKSSLVSYLIAKAVVKVNFISLVNLIANKMIVKELIQDDFNPSAVIGELNQLIENKIYRSEVLNGYNEIISILGQPGASDRTAELMYNYLINS